MHILILGNGFDLAHGLKTKYSDFLEYCIDKKRNTVPPVVNYGTSFIDNIWLRHFITTYNRYGKNWIDLENEIYNVILSLNKIMLDLSMGEIWQIFPLMFSIQKNIQNFNFYQISNHLKIYKNKRTVNNKKYSIVKMNDFSHLYVYFYDYQGFINFIYDQLRDFVGLFEKYLSEVVVASINSEPKFQLSLLGDLKPNIMNFLFVLNFNYTDTLMSLYECIMDSRQKKSIQNFHVHGKINANNMVLGSQFFDNKNTNIPTTFNVFRKHNQRHKYNAIEEYQSLLHIIKSSNGSRKCVFHVVGHSLDKTDHTILKHIFSAREDVIINIYYHDEESQERLINNITDIIGEDEVMSKVRFIHQHDPKRGILIPQKQPNLIYQ